MARIEEVQRELLNYGTDIYKAKAGEVSTTTKTYAKRLAALLSQGCDEPKGCMECLYALGRPGPAYIPNPGNENCKHCTRGRTDHYTPTEPKE